MRLYHQLVEPLAKGKGSAHNKALSCSVCANKPFLQTQLGKAVFALYRVYLTAGFPWDTNALSDVLHSSFLALPKQRVYNLDALIRGNRLMSRDEALEILRGSSDEVSGILRGSSVDSDSASTSPDEPVSKDDSKPKSSGIEAFRILENLLIKHDEESFNAAFKRVQSLQSVGALTQEQATESFGVLQIMRSSCERAALAGVVDLPDLMAIYQSMSVVLNFCSTELSYAQHADVRIMTRSAAAKLPPRCCDTLILCDETSAENPLSRHENAVDLFLKKFGYTQAESIVNAERRKFLHLLDLAKDSLIIERQLLDDEASSSYFSAMAQEFINAYRKPEDLETGDDIDNVFQIPQFLQEGMYTCGEYEVDGAQDLGAQAGKASNLDEALGADKGTSFDKRAAKRTAKEAAPDKNTDLMQMIYAGLDLQEFSPLSTKDAIYAYLPQGSALKNNVAFRNTEEFPVNKDSLPRLSASQIELYMQCPFKWFVERRLNISALDENFGPITLGTLIHSCFELFYERFKEQTQCNKVTVDTLEQAKDIMAASFDEVYKKQCSNKYCGRRHAAQPETSEELEIASLKEQLIEWLEFEVDFLPEFEQALSEFKIKPEEAVFANAKWSGSIDRVDVRKNDGAIAIIDYKGSLKDSYLPTKRLRGGNKEYTENRGSKIQAALYLLILRDLIKSNAQSIQESDNARALFGAQVETVLAETAQVTEQAQSEVETAQVIGQAQSGVETAQGAGKAQSEVALPQEIRVHAAQEALCAALYVSYKRGHDVIGLINNDILKYDFVDKKNYNRMAFSGGSSQIEPETKGGHAKNEPLPENLWQSEHPSFNTVLEGIELRVGEAVKNLRNAQVYPAPISKEPCEYCTMQACPMRET